MAASGGASHRRILFASLVGTAVEFYDFYIYATAAALVFGPLFFPSESASAQLMLAYASRSEEHTSELQPLMRISYAVFCLKKKKIITHNITLLLRCSINT